MLFNVSCNHSLKKSQIETKCVVNKQKSLQTQESSFVLLTSLSYKIKQIQKKIQKKYKEFLHKTQLQKTGTSCIVVITRKPTAIYTKPIFT